MAFRVPFVHEIATMSGPLEASPLPFQARGNTVSALYGRTGGQGGAKVHDRQQGTGATSQPFLRVRDDDVTIDLDD